MSLDLVAEREDFTAESGRKVRIDKGAIKVTDRDEIVLQWVSEQMTVSLELLNLLLRRATAEIKGISIAEAGTLSERAVRKVVDRWVGAGWVGFLNPYRRSSGYVFMTHQGNEDFETGFTFNGEPSLSMLKHQEEVNRVRLFLENFYLDKGGMSWVPERVLRRDKTMAHCPDGVLNVNDMSIAIEIERSRKTQKRAETIMGHLIKGYDSVWYFVTDETEATVKKASRGHEKIKIRNLKDFGGSSM